MEVKTKTKEERRQEREERERKQEILIAKYEQNPFLYDKENPAYKDAKKRTDTIEEIGDLLNWTKNELMSNWWNLRDRYKKEKKRMEEDKSGAAARKGNKQWKFLESFKFLDEHLRRRSSLCTTEEQDDIQEDNTQDDNYGTQGETENKTQDSESQEEYQEETERPSEAGSQSIIVETNMDLTQITQEMLDDATHFLIGEPAPKKMKTAEGARSNSLTPHLPVLSPKGKKSVYAARNRAKKEAELESDIKEALSKLDNLVSTPLTGESTDRDTFMLLGESIGAALKGMKDEKKQSAWKRKLRLIICDIEEGLGPNESTTMMGA